MVPRLEQMLQSFSTKLALLLKESNVFTCIPLTLSTLTIIKSFFKTFLSPASTAFLINFIKSSVTQLSLWKHVFPSSVANFSTSHIVIGNSNSQFCWRVNPDFLLRNPLIILPLIFLFKAWEKVTFASAFFLYWSLWKRQLLSVIVQSM